MCGKEAEKRKSRRLIFECSLFRVVVATLFLRALFFLVDLGRGK